MFFDLMAKLKQYMTNSQNVTSSDEGRLEWIPQYFWIGPNNSAWKLAI